MKSDVEGEPSVYSKEYSRGLSKLPADDARALFMAAWTNAGTEVLDQEREQVGVPRPRLLQDPVKSPRGGRPMEESPQPEPMGASQSVQDQRLLLTQSPEESLRTDVSGVLGRTLALLLAQAAQSPQQAEEVEAVGAAEGVPAAAAARSGGFGQGVPPSSRGADLATLLAHERRLKERALTSHILPGPLSDIKERYLLHCKELGSGHTGVIRKCMEKSTGQIYACKSISKSKIRVSNCRPSS